MGTDVYLISSVKINPIVSLSEMQSQGNLKRLVSEIYQLQFLVAHAHGYISYGFGVDR